MKFSFDFSMEFVRYSLFAIPPTWPPALGLTSSLVQEVKDETEMMAMTTKQNSFFIRFGFKEI
jgi:hypothetical protein